MTDLSGWKRVQMDGDPDILFKDGMVHADLRSRCEAHGPDILCRRCIERVVETLQFARLAVDPAVKAELDYHPSPLEVPESLALVNPMNNTAYVMRRAESRKLVATKPLWTTHLEKPFSEAVRVLDYVTESNVCDAKHVSGFQIRLAEPAPMAWMERFLDSKIRFEIDGEPVFGSRERPLRLKAILGHRILLERARQAFGVLFHAAGVLDGKRADPDGFHGWMLPNGTHLTVDLDQVPGGGDLVRIETEMVLSTYTTRKLEPEPAADGEKSQG